MEATAIAPAHVVFFALILMDMMKRRFNPLVQLVANAQPFLELRDHWVPAAGLALCLIGQRIFMSCAWHLG